MARFRVTEYVMVRVISEPIEAEEPIRAYREYRKRVDLAQLLRNVTGTVYVSEVEFDNYRDSATVDQLHENGDFAETAMKLSEQEINDPADL